MNPKSFLLLLCMFLRSNLLPAQDWGKLIIQDVDGNTYETVTIGHQVWMKQNLKTTRFNDGTTIPQLNQNSLWAKTNASAYCWLDNDSSNKELFGAIYNGYAIEKADICPEGWHVPTDSDWQVLEMTLGMSESIVKKPGWRGGEANALAGKKELWVAGSFKEHPLVNSTGFTGLPAGNRIGENGSFGNSGSNAYWWSTTQYDDYIWVRALFYGSNHIIKEKYPKNYGFSIRCVMD